MDPASAGVGGFRTTGAAYDAFMGRYSRQLAVGFATATGVRRGQEALDIGCGPGALTGVLVERLGADAVAACDPSPEFVAECQRHFPDVDVRAAGAEALPYDDDRFDLAAAQLVLHFVAQPGVAATEMRRVVRPGGVVAACVWDFEREMEMLRAFWDAALAVDASAPDEARTLRFGRAGETAELFVRAGLERVEEITISVTAGYAHFDELWDGFMFGVGPAGAYCVSLAPDVRDALRTELFDRVGSPTGSFELSAMARSALAHVPG